MTEEWDPERNEVAALAALMTTDRGSPTLEIGAGDGRLAARLSDFSRRVIGVDPSLGAVARGRRTRPGKHLLVVASALDLPFRDRCFDQAVFGWSL